MQNLNIESSARKLKNVRFLTLFFLVSCFYAIKINKGFPTFDESLYITLPWRFLTGDSLFRDEWMGMQMSSVLLLPFMKLFMLIRPNMNYVILFFRIIYWCFQVFVCIAIYIILKKKTLYADVMAIVYYAFVPYGMMALSYNSIPLGLLAILSSLIVSEEIHRLLGGIIAGICMAGIVICQPACILLVVGLFFISIGKERVINLKDFTIIFIVCALCGSLFLVYVLMGIDIADLVNAFGASQNDTAHFTNHALLKRMFFIDAVYWIKRPHVLQFILGWTFLFFADCYAKKKHENEYNSFVTYSFIFGLVISCSFLICEAVFLTREVGMNAIMIPFTPVGIWCWRHLSKERKKEMRGYMFCIFLSIGYLYCNHLLSNVTPFAIANGCFISSLMSIPIVLSYIQGVQIECKKQLLSNSIIVMLLGAELFVFIGNVFCDKNISDLDYYVDCGPAKGLYTSYENYINYKYTLYDLDRISAVSMSDEVLLYIDMEMLIVGGPIYHLYTEDRMSAPVAYSGHELFEEGGMLQHYYDLYPDKKPTVVFIPDMVINSNHSVSEEEIMSVCNKYGLKRYECNSDAVLLMK